MSHYLFYISQNYSFEILRPLQQEIERRGDRAHWFVEGNEVNHDNFGSQDSVLESIKQVKAYKPKAVFVPGNYVPNFIPGLKVQVFHGFEWKKKGHFRIRDCFDLYCTQGPLFTRKFNELRSVHGHFRVMETGWPKVDPLFEVAPWQWPNEADGPLILYAPTFSPALTSSPALYEPIKRLSEQKGWRWVIKFHPKMNPDWVDQFKALQNDRLIVAEAASINPLLKAADVMVSDTSSVITEFSLLERPVVTLNNLQPETHMMNISEAGQLESAVEKALSPNNQWRQAIKQATAELHPFYDGRSSARVLDAVDKAISLGRGDLKNKPANYWRQLKLRMKLGYWGR